MKLLDTFRRILTYREMRRCRPETPEEAEVQESLNERHETHRIYARVQNASRMQ